MQYHNENRNDNRNGNENRIPLPPSTSQQSQPAFWTRYHCSPSGDVRVESFDKEGCAPSSLKSNQTFRNGTDVNATRGAVNVTRYTCRRPPVGSHVFVAVVNVDFPKSNSNDNNRNNNDNNNNNNNNDNNKPRDGAAGNVETSVMKAAVSIMMIFFVMLTVTF